jgi:hypothetical protein
MMTAQGLVRPGQLLAWTWCYDLGILMLLQLGCVLKQRQA